MKVINSIHENIQKKKLALLIDPDKINEASLENRIGLINEYQIDLVFVGGSLISSDKMDWVLSELKLRTNVPKIIFPGHGTHINDKADALLLLSLISGRNAEFLIGQHVIAAPALRRSGLELIPVAYMLVDGGTATTVSYISNTTPLPNNKPDVAAATAMAGEMLGLKLIYLDAGSGAMHPVNPELIKAVKKAVEIPVIVGGGINNISKVEAALSAGADIIVVGNAVEENPSFLAEVSDIINAFNYSMN